MTRTSGENQKKSETLEVRISYDTKQKLSGRAETEGRTVSELVRSQIDTYLANPALGTEPSIFGDIAMRLKYFATQKPKTLMVSLAALAASSFLFIPTASAEGFMLDMQGEFVEILDEADAKRIRRFDTEIMLDFGSTIIMNIQGQLVTEDIALIKDGLWVKVTFDETDEASYDEKGISISLSLIEKVDGVKTVLASPRLISAYDETASLITELEDKSYSFKFSPRNKT